MAGKQKVKKLIQAFDEVETELPGFSQRLLLDALEKVDLQN
jgi:hypothetical protein